MKRLLFISLFILVVVHIANCKRTKTGRPSFSHSTERPSKTQPSGSAFSAPRQKKGNGRSGLQLSAQQNSGSDELVDRFRPYPYVGANHRVSTDAKTHTDQMRVVQEKKETNIPQNVQQTQNSDSEDTRQQNAPQEDVQDVQQQNTQQEQSQAAQQDQEQVQNPEVASAESSHVIETDTTQDQPAKPKAVPTFGQIATQPDDECWWDSSWSTWSPCSVECGGGYTERMKSCICGENGVVDDSRCAGETPKEHTECGLYECNGPRPRNINYWRVHSDPWPLPSNPHFDCKNGANAAIQAQTWSQILQGTHGDRWYALARSFIVASINAGMTAAAPERVTALLSEAENVLSYCNGLTPEMSIRADDLRDSLHDYNQGYVMEPIPNNAGAVTDLAEESAIMAQLDINGPHDGAKDGASREFPDQWVRVIGIGIPVTAVILSAIFAGAGYAIYKLKQRRAQVLASFEEDQDPVPIPLF